ncbi:MAG: hypothetical protein KME08_04875 [Aphanothece sp. CMT-3BRIN-NPC111]|nr:hypothetical protein [Aphanothece sp. CMT-3BRIN-NPC111]
MNEDNEYKKYFRDEGLDKGEISYDIPAEQKLPFQEKLPSGYDPMGEIYLEGRAYSNISEGNSKWWIIISSWIIFGLPNLYVFFWSLSELIRGVKIIFTVGFTARMFFIVALVSFVLFCSSSFLALLGKGTVRKLYKKRKKNRIK